MVFARKGKLCWSFNQSALKTDFSWRTEQSLPVISQSPVKQQQSLLITKNPKNICSQNLPMNLSFDFIIIYTSTLNHHKLSRPFYALIFGQVVNIQNKKLASRSHGKNFKARQLWVTNARYLIRCPGKYSHKLLNCFILINRLKSNISRSFFSTIKSQSERIN